MQNFKKQLIVIMSCALMFNTPAVYAQEAAPAPAQPGTTPPPADSELSLENELNQAQTPAPGTSVPTSTEPIPAEATMQTPAEPSMNVSETNIVTNEVPNDLDETYAMNGYSLGFVLVNQNFNVDAEMHIDDTQKVDLSSKSSDFQSVGVMGRYAILPHNRLGTDLNVSIGNTINHDSVNYGSITVVRAELNLGYAIPFGKTNSAYILAGGGYEIVMGSDIQKMLVPGGSLTQIGGGIGFGKFNVELFYSYGRHQLSQKFLDDAANAGAATGEVDFEGSKSIVISNVIQGRLIYNY